MSSNSSDNYPASSSGDNTLTPSANAVSAGSATGPPAPSPISVAGSNSPPPATTPPVTPPPATTPPVAPPPATTPPLAPPPATTPLVGSSSKQSMLGVNMVFAISAKNGCVVSTEDAEKLAKQIADYAETLIKSHAYTSLQRSAIGAPVDDASPAPAVPPASGPGPVDDEASPAKKQKK